jgi:sugar phosphate isomerase/epimerase
LAVSIEPHLGSVAATVEAAGELCAAVPGLTLTVDYSHFVAQNVAQDLLGELFDRARHAHLRQAAPGRLQCPHDEGVIDVAALLDAARQHGFNGSVALEYVHSPMWEMNRLDVLSETIRMRDQVRNLTL